MDKNMDFQGYPPYDMNFDPAMAPNMSEMYRDPVMNPMMQYEQGYMYYRYLSQQMEYKIKCKEYEKMCGRSERKIE